MGLKADKLPVPSESTEQRNLFAWAAMQSAAWPQLRLLYHVPNGGYRTAAGLAQSRCNGSAICGMRDTAQKSVAAGKRPRRTSWTI